MASPLLPPDQPKPPTGEEPLRERCAIALGWKRCTEQEGCDGWYDPSGERDCEAHYDPLPPYGDNTPEGWACTGPLIERFGLDVFRESTKEGKVLYWSCSEDSRYTEMRETRAATPVEAIAEWAAHHAAQAKETR